MQPPRPADLEGRLIANSVHARLFPGDERPTRIGNYVIIRRIGGGAMGDVFLAHHESLDRQAAIKLVRPAAEDSTIERQRLLREATILAKIDHPHVIGVHDSGTHDNRVYLAMEYVKGVTLGVWQKGRPWRALLDVYLKAGRGLQAVHAVVLDADERAATGTTRRCLCHRDFKPDNVLISDHGDVRVADFGLAVPTQRPGPGQGGRAIDLRLTADASVVGTPLYISPEQLSGSPGDARSDQYSFCVALYEALYDQHPYYAPAPAVRASELATDSGGPGGTHPQFALFEAILGAPLRPAPRSKVPRRIHTILARGLQRDPAARYPSMAALLAALEHDPKRRPLQAFAGIAVIGTAFGVGMAVQGDLPQLCENLERETAELWSDARQTQVHDAFVATGASHAESSFAAADQRIRSFLDRWSEARQDACTAAYLSGSQTHDAHQRSMSCLDRQLDLVGDVIGGLDTVNSSTVAGIRERLEVLPDPGICDSRNIHARSCSYEPPSDPTITRVRKQIKDAQAAEIAGRTVQAGELAATAAAAARAAGTPTLVIDAHFTLGRVLAELGRPAPALDAMRTALRAAEAASCDPAAIDLDAAISKLVALNPSLDLGVGHLVNELGLARLDRVDEHDPGRKAQLLNDRGLLHEYRDEDYAAAERDYRAALQLRIESGLDDTTAQARSQQNLGNVLGKPDTTPEAAAERLAAVAAYRHSYGEEHPAQWKPLFNLGLAQYDLGQLEAAEATLNSSLSYAQAMLGTDSPDVRDIHLALAQVANDRRTGREAERHALAGLRTCPTGRDEPTCSEFELQRAYARALQGDRQNAVEIRQRVFATSRLHYNETDLIDQRIELATLLVDLERWEEALVHMLVARSALPDKISDQRLPEVTLYLGEALLGSDRAHEAVSAFESLHVLADGNPMLRASAQWGLARSLCAAGGDTEQAKDFARIARGFYAGDLGDPMTAARVADIDVMLQSKCLSKPKK